MKLINIEISNGINYRKEEFSKNNLIYSEKNSTGKTTLIRSILYALGFRIPSTRGLDFSKMDFVMTMENNKGIFVIHRHGSYISISDDKFEKSYSLPSDYYEVISTVFDCNSNEIIDNILGIFYIDQDKGWNLLNRGKVIGDNRFYIENFLKGLSGIDDKENRNKLKAINDELEKYIQMAKVAEYQENIGLINKEDFDESESDKIDRQINLLNVKKYQLTKEIKKITNSIKGNKLLSDYISSLNLIVKSSSGEEILVNKETLYDFLDNDNFLKTRKELLTKDLNKISNELESLNEERNKQSALVDVQTMIEHFDADIKKIHVDGNAVKKVINQLKNEKSQIEKSLKELSEKNNDFIDLLNKVIYKYLNEFDIFDKFEFTTSNYVMINKLKNFSGTMLHLLVFSFRLAYIKIIEDNFKINLPIIIDSPSGAEIKKETVDKMIEVIQRDFCNHQLIIASINNYEMNDKKIIEIKNRLLDKGGLISI